MSYWAVDAAAGYGKTFRLMQVLGEALVKQPLKEGQKVLALTFMHGSRRRLNEKLRAVPGLNGCYACMTIDSLAWRLRERWWSLGSLLGFPPPGAVGAFDVECEFAAMLLREGAVQQWTASSFPIVVVDEAQDLTSARLEMVAALGGIAQVFLAADEFQCLNPTLRPNPLAQWLPTVCKPETLPKPMRTNVAALLNAAVAVREGKAPPSEGKFKIMAGSSVPLASAQLANAIRWSGGGSIAIIAPSTQSKFVREVVLRVQTEPSGKNKDLGPYAIRWEESDRDEFARLANLAEMPEKCSITAAVGLLRTLPRSGPAEQTIAWLQRIASTTGRADTTSAEVSAQLQRFISIRRQQSKDADRGIHAMTVHQAKNREFDGVVVMWPFEFKADDEGKRRLLYNAVTRARRWCSVIVQSDKMLKSPPFS